MELFLHLHICVHFVHRENFTLPLPSFYATVQYIISKFVMYCEDICVTENVNFSSEPLCERQISSVCSLSDNIL